MSAIWGQPFHLPSLPLSSAFLFLLSLLSRWPLISFPTPPLFLPLSSPPLLSPLSACVSRVDYADKLIGRPYPCSLATVRWTCRHSQRPPLMVRDMSSGTRVVLFYASNTILHRKTLNTVTPSNFYRYSAKCNRQFCL